MMIKKEVWIVVYYASPDYPAVGGIVVDSAWSSFDLAEKREATLIQAGHDAITKIIRLDLDSKKK